MVARFLPLLLQAGVLLLALTGCICRAQSKNFKCSIINEAGFCFIENVHLDVSTNGIGGDSIQFPRHPTLLIKSGAIPYFGKDIFALLGNTKQLHVYNQTSIRNLFIPVTNLTEINVQRNGLLEFDVEPVENRELKMLSIVHNGLVTVPRNIRFLVGLEKLYLYNNSLEYFDLEPLANASHSLKILSIYDNHIKTLDSRSALYFPKLQTLSLSKNKLAFVPYFEESFPAVTVVSLRKTPGTVAGCTRPCSTLRRARYRSCGRMRPVAIGGSVRSAARTRCWTLCSIVRRLRYGASSSCCGM